MNNVSDVESLSVKLASVYAKFNALCPSAQLAVITAGLSSMSPEVIKTIDDADMELINRIVEELMQCKAIVKEYVI